MFHIIICDDDELFANEIKNMIFEIGLGNEGALFTYYSSGEQLIYSLDRQDKCDLLIMDMQMKKYDGHETAKYFRKYFPDSLLVYCSGIVKPTVESFNALPFRYLIKDYSLKKMKSELIVVIEEMKKRKDVIKIEAKQGNDTVLLKTDDILFIENYRYGSIIHVIENSEEVNRKFTTNKKLQTLMKELEKEGFQYAHNSYVVNLKYVVRLQNNTELRLINGEILGISRSKIKDFKLSFMNWVSKKYD